MNVTNIHDAGLHNANVQMQISDIFVICIQSVWSPIVLCYFWSDFCVFLVLLLITTVSHWLSLYDVWSMVKGIGNGLFVQVCVVKKIGRCVCVHM